MKSNSQNTGDNITGKNVSTCRFLLHNFFSLSWNKDSILNKAKNAVGMGSNNNSSLFLKEKKKETRLLYVASIRDRLLNSCIVTVR